MFPHRLPHALNVTRAERFDDSRMRLCGSLIDSLRPVHQTEKSKEGRRNLIEGGPQNGAAGLLPNEAMKPQVCLTDLEILVSLNAYFDFPGAGDQFVKVVVGHVDSCFRGRHLFQGKPNPNAVPHILNGQIRDLGASIGNTHHQAHLFELPKCFSNCGLTHVQGFRKPDFRKRLTGPELASENGLSQDVHDLSPQRLGPGRLSQRCIHHR